ncbi:MAG: hypothetical protein QOD83_1454 [Solirubrobacteraceae bacterium]|nr:hypothetical protein [Solirubrobacteraceae bacterium]
MAVRARAWRHGTHAAVFDVVQPWTHGTIVRATRYPNYFDFNVVRVEKDPAMNVQALVGDVGVQQGLEQLAEQHDRRGPSRPSVGDSLKCSSRSSEPICSGEAVESNHSAGRHTCAIEIPVRIDSASRGRLQISTGTVEAPKERGKPMQLSWSRLADLLEQHATPKR